MSIIAISGSWRTVNAQVRQDVELDVRRALGLGHKIITGGALGVDFIATNAALEFRGDITGRLQVILPTPYNVYRNHFAEAAAKRVITERQAFELFAQLETVKVLGEDAFVTMHGTACNPDTYYARNAAVIDAADELYAYHVNGSPGVQDAIDRARVAGKPVWKREYQIAA